MRRRGVWRCIFTLALMLVSSQAVHAFVLPQNANIGPGSEWVYDSNLGTARSQILSRVKEDDHWLFRWRLQVAGLSYEEGLRLTDKKLSVVDRLFSAFHVYHDSFAFPTDELTLCLPLKVGSEWEWDGVVTHGEEIGANHVRGRVVRIAKVTVPAGEFEAYEIELERTDDFGTDQRIRLWFNAEIGVVKAIGQLRWRGFVGRMQDLAGFDDFTVELRAYHIVPPE